MASPASKATASPTHDPVPDLLPVRRLHAAGRQLAYRLLPPFAGMIGCNDLGLSLTSVLPRYSGSIESFVLIAVSLFMLAGGLPVVVFAIGLSIGGGR